MKHRLYPLLVSTLTCWGLIGGTALARTFEYKPLPLLENPDPNPCPEKVISYETNRPYQEGGYSIDGQISLTAIASNIYLARRDEFSVTWIGTLKPQYRTCKASAGITTVDGEKYEGHSYMQLQFINGKVYFTLDMTGQADANGYTTKILSTTFRSNNPRWNWGGTD